MRANQGTVESSNANGDRCMNRVLVNILTKCQGGAILPMEGTKLQELKQKKKMETTWCDSCGLAKGLGIYEVKSRKIGEKMFKIVVYSPKPKVADKRNRSTHHKSGTEV